jgi:hypothetical protein
MRGSVVVCAALVLMMATLAASSVLLQNETISVTNTCSPGRPQLSSNLPVWLVTELSADLAGKARGR